MAISTVVALPITEKKPLMPHAQGMRASRCGVNALSPDGKGSPIGMARGAMMALQISIRVHSDNGERIFWSHESEVMRTMPITPMIHTAPHRCFGFNGQIFPASRLPIPEKTRNELIPKTGHYTYNYLKTLEIVFNMGEGKCL